jgi:hypothetical protein
VILAPALSTALMIVRGLFWIPWWIMIGFGLLRMENKLSNEGKETKQDESFGDL